VSNVQAQPEKVRRTGPKGYIVRFVFGGLVTAAVGIVGTAFGPVVAGLFLAFPAILPASATLLEHHEGTASAGADAIGAAAGCVGLFAFGAVVWGLATSAPAALVLLLAAIAWLAVSLSTWWIARRVKHALKPVDRPEKEAIQSGAVGRGQAVRQRTLDPRS
jgi:hypothetical protein